MTPWRENDRFVCSDGAPPESSRYQDSRRSSQNQPRSSAKRRSGTTLTPLIGVSATAGIRRSWSVRTRRRARSFAHARALGEVQHREVRIPGAKRCPRQRLAAQPPAAGGSAAAAAAVETAGAAPSLPAEPRRRVSSRAAPGGGRRLRAAGALAGGAPAAGGGTAAGRGGAAARAGPGGRG